MNVFFFKEWAASSRDHVCVDAESDRNVRTIIITDNYSHIIYNLNIYYYLNTPS